MRLKTARLSLATCRKLINLRGLIAGQLLLSVCLGTAAPAWAEDTAGSTAPQAAKVGDLPEGDLTVEDVTVEGNRLVPSEDILGVIKTRRGDKFDREQVMQDLKAVNSMGYFDDRALQAVPEMGGTGVLLKIRVQENAPVTQFGFQGNSVVSSEDLSKLFADQLGKPQNLTQLSQAIDKVEQAYHEKGYMLARVTDVKDDPDGSVNIKVDEGKIGDIKIVGNKKTKDFIIRNAIKLKPGMVYNERALTADLRKLYGNGYFQDIRRSLTPDPSNPDKYTLKVEVDEKRTGSVGLGGGVDTMFGPFGSLSFSDANFRGRGQVLQFSSQVGSGVFNGFNNGLNNGGTAFLPTGMNQYQVQADWVEPNFRGTNTALGLSGFGRNFASLMIDNAAQRTLGASATFSKPLGKNWTGSLAFSGSQTALRDLNNIFNTSPGAFTNGLIWNSNGSPGMLTARAMQLGYGGGDVNRAAAFAQQVRNAQLRGGFYATITPTLMKSSVDDIFDPHKGSTVKLTGGPSIGIGSGTFGKIGASVSKYFALGKETTLATNIQGGSLLGGAPAFSQFMLGGFNGLRGYRQFSDLGTGTGMLMGSVELRRRLPLPKGDKHSAGGMLLSYIDKNVRGVTFFDYGAVTGNGLTNSLYSRNAWGASVGVGIRINVPMLGLVRLDYGLPLVSTALGRFTPRFTLGFGDKF